MRFCRLLASTIFAAACATACGEMEPAQNEDSPYCEKGFDFTYIYNGKLSNNSESPVMNVAEYNEVVIYLEEYDAECDGGNGFSMVDLVFKPNEESPWGRTGQFFVFTDTGGRFRVDGKYLKLETRCSGAYSFKYSVDGVLCAK